jgi:hypothetical protein
MRKNYRKVNARNINGRKILKKKDENRVICERVEF